VITAEVERLDSRAIDDTGSVNIVPNWHDEALESVAAWRDFKQLPPRRRQQQRRERAEAPVPPLSQSVR
jgi:hypothetical protein